MLHYYIEGIFQDGGKKMKTTVDFSDFVDGFQKIGRENQFSYDGLITLFNFLENLEEEIGEEIEFDPIGICSEFTESTLDDINNDFDMNFKSLSAARKFLEEQTNVIGVTNDSIVYENF